MMTGSAGSETKGELKVRSVLGIEREEETLSLPGRKSRRLTDRMV